MKINFFDLKELAGLLTPPAPSVNPPNPFAGAPINPKELTEHIIQEMFDLHMQASRTLWDRKMFEDELKREGSGFIICYSNDGIGKIADDLHGSRNGRGSGGTVPDIYSGMKLNMESIIAGFFIFYNVADEMHILDITVAKEMQSKGIGTLMLDYVLKKYKSLNIKYFYLEVRASNEAAVKLYKKFGFKIFMLRKSYYEDNGENALCMVKEL